jgi:PGF-CTERM protein
MLRAGQAAGVGVIAALVLVAAVGGATAAGPPAASDAEQAVAATATGATAANATRAATSHRNLTVLVAPGRALSELRGASSIANYSAQITLRPRPTLADTMLVRVSAPGLADAVAAQPGNTTTARFFSLLDSDGANLRMYEVAPTEEGPFKAIDVTDSEAVTVVPGEGDRFDLVADPAALNGTLDRDSDELPDAGGAPVGVESFDTYQFNFTFDGRSELKAISVFPTVATIAPNQPNDRPRVFPAANQTIRGTTTVAPGTRLDVDLVVRGDEGFTLARTVTVTNRSLSEFAAEFDLQDAAGARNISVVARLDGRPIGASDGRLLDLSARLVAPDRSDSRDRLRLPRVNLSQGGFVIVRPAGSDRIVGKRYLTSGPHEGVTVSLLQGIRADALNVTVYVDYDADRRFDGDGPDRPYRTVLGLVSSTVSLAEPTTPVPTPLPTTTRPPTTTTQPPTTVTTRVTTSPPTRTDVDPVAGPERNTSTTFTPYTFTVESGPGFGVGLALLALLFVGLLAARRVD